MLFISRWVGLGGVVGVVDTTDGSEDIMAQYRLKEAVFEKGLTIAGWGRLHHPYQPSETKTQLQLKTKLLSFIDIETYNGSVTSVRWDSGKLRKPASIRLSDFGSNCTDFILRANESTGSHQMTLVFDDKLDKLPPYAVTPVIWPYVSLHEDVRYDLREVRDTMLALSIYRSIFTSSELTERGDTPLPSQILESVVDDEERRYKMSRAVVSGKLWR